MSFQRGYQSKPKPDSRRFEEFEEFSDGTGFVIQERKRSIEFYFDQQRGWFDEHGNYFGPNGQYDPKPSKESLAFWATVKHRYEHEDDELLNEYEINLSGGDDDDYDGDDDFDDFSQQQQPDYNELGNLIQHPNDHKHGSSSRQQPQPVIKRSDLPSNNKPDPKQETKPAPTKPAEKKDVKPVKKEEPKHIVKVEVKQPEKHQEEHKVQQQQNQKPQPVAETKPKLPVYVNDPNDVDVLVQGLGEKETEEAFIKWLQGKVPALRLKSHRSRVDKGNRDIKLVFQSLQDADDVLSQFEGEKKTAYKGKFSVSFKLLPK